jgi:hypothetical protein
VQTLPLAGTRGALSSILLLEGIALMHVAACMQLPHACDVCAVQRIMLVLSWQWVITWRSLGSPLLTVLEASVKCVCNDVYEQASHPAPECRPSKPSQETLQECLKRPSLDASHVFVCRPHAG